MKSIAVTCILTSAFLYALLFAFCTSPSSPGENDTTPATAGSTLETTIPSEGVSDSVLAAPCTGLCSEVVIEDETPYVISGDSLVVNGPDGIIACDSSCYGDSMERYCDTAEVTALLYKLDGDTLYISEDEDQKDQMDSGAEYRIWFVLKRSGGGAGLQGIWTFIGGAYTILSGSPTAAEIAEIADAAREMIQDADEGIQYEITSTHMNTYAITDDEPWTIVELMADNLIFDTTLYNITITVADSATATLKGNTTGETVTLTFDSQTGDLTYKSTHAGHAAHTYYDQPTVCPNRYRPEWFDGFLSDNRI
jgi:hypothetical protein